MVTKSNNRGVEFHEIAE